MKNVEPAPVEGKPEWFDTTAMTLKADGGRIGFSTGKSANF